MRDGPALLRPFLALPRAAIDAYAAARGLAWVDDESNANTGVKRNFLRHDVAPRLAAAFPGYPATLARAAAHQAEAARLIDELAQLDAQGAIADDAVAGATLDRAALVALAARAPHRARNLLRWFLRHHELPRRRRRDSPRCSTSSRAPRRTPASASFTRGPRSGSIAGASSCTRRRSPRSRSAWRGEARLALPHGTLEFVSCAGAGVALRGAGRRPTSRSGPAPAASASGSPTTARAGR